MDKSCSQTGITKMPQFTTSRAGVLWVAEIFGNVVYERPYDDIAPDNIHFTRRGYDGIANVLRE